MSVQRLVVIVTFGLLGLAISAFAVWGTLAIVFTLAPDGLRLLLAGGFALCSLLVLAGLFSPRWRRRALLAYLLPLTALWLCWQSLQPSNQRDWQADVAVLPYASISGNQVRVHNIRNFSYRSEYDYQPAYYDQDYDLNQLQGVDLVSSYWMGPAIAHVFLSFAFADGKHLAVSIETRKENTESYSTLKGFFRQYELFYVVADERDVLKLRTNYRQDPPEQTYLYRLKGPIESGRQLFLEYMHSINALKQQPQFYNSLTTNCTTAIWMTMRDNPQSVPFNWKILASGYLPEYLYEQGLLHTDGLSFTELQRRALLNPRGQAIGDAEDFSRLIRTPASAH